MTGMTDMETLRPRYHFTPPRMWMNDPNGLVYYAGEYHLFYQHNPADIVWGPMHWGHAVSRDLVHWQHLPIALYPDDNGTIFSGSAVIDWDNTAGFGAEAMVAVFTHDRPGRECQSLAYSLDRGRSWTMYSGNPVLLPPPNTRDFRDPKVFWDQANDQPGHWVMVLAAGSAIQFYSSLDLKHWELSGSFGDGYVAAGGVWETPDLFSLPIDSGSERLWVLTAGASAGGPAGGSGMRYFVGDFDGRTFTSANPKETVLWVDQGADFYAAQSWSGAPDGRHLWIGWMCNLRYAALTPTTSWRSAMTVPRELSLASTPAGIRLAQQPVTALQSLRSEARTWRDQILTPGTNLLAGLVGDPFEVIAQFRIAESGAVQRFGLRLNAAGGPATTIGYDIKAHKLTVERGVCGEPPFSEDFAGRHAAVLEPRDGVVDLHIWVDRSSVEVFGDGGLTVITDQVFPCPGGQYLELFAEGGPLRLISLEFYSLQPAEFTAVAGD
jgi:fructan beta-fructosidase